ncbi:anthranilate synthase component I family protein [Brevundimonas sp. S30B]|uniref:anthranilate synthase component I family protein n=1 Tax=unclassified Brevundimonas TaxID=2622653 RepID=UPI001072CE63|nr:MULTISPECIES: anthranilate synthase component I family protein [unclassified Brevundimonas]QBX37292.1 anthranilate synthase component I family protein [Brevundimonas sp. MF30-B]TFW03915.1 anthranilate synthase component I family protein [Brevundimonas sp. S30B]
MSLWTATDRRQLAWRDPQAVAAGLAPAPGALLLMSDGGPLGRYSWLTAQPERIEICDRVRGDLFAALRDPLWSRGVAGLAAYDVGARPATGDRGGGWPDLILGRYPAWLRFDHHTRRLTAIGHGIDETAARCARAMAETWLDRSERMNTVRAPAETWLEEVSADAYRQAVAQVVRRIGEGELFQANIARAWSGRLKAHADPIDAFFRLQSGRASAYGAAWRLDNRALVSNSPELFLTFDPASRRIETRPIKGTRPRRADAAADAAEAHALAHSAKDRAENLMIVDLMRNDLARVSEPGSVTVDRLFAVERLPTVHHLVSTVSARARAEVQAADLLQAAFPPGSITGAPKHQAMKVIADLEPPRGPWCGSLFHLDDEGRLAASVLIRTAGFERGADGWTYRTLAGAGITADSDPHAEADETEAKIRALREALIGSYSL